MKKIAVWLVVLVAAVVAAGAFAWHAMTGPMYRPGDVRAGKDLAGPLTPATSGGERWQVAPGVALHHFEEGAGTPVLVVHGGPGFPPSQPWRAGAALADGYRIVYYHQRGCGLSSRPVQSLSGANMYSAMVRLHQTLGLPAQVADIERIRRILGVERIVLMGHSFGCDLAALYAAEFPERVRALVFAAPAGLAVLPVPGGGLFERVRERLPAAMQPEYRSYLAQYFDFRRAFQRTESASSAFYGQLARYYGAAAGETAVMPGGIPECGYVPLAVYCSMGRHHDYRAAYRSVRAPALVIHGSRDLQPEAVSRSFAALFPASRFARIEGGSHFVYDDRPREFASEVRSFLGAIPQ